jgi:hypothetical protein
MIDGIFCEVLNERIWRSDEKEYTVYSAKKVNKEQYLFIARLENHYAHATDLSQAFKDLQFKIIAEKLKNEPINAETEITVQHYRLLTGACDFGCRSWLEANKIPYEVIDEKTVEKQPMKAKELFSILEKTNAYGFEKFKSLVTF